MHQQNRLSTITLWFSQFNETFQAVTLVTLFTKTTPRIAKFLSLILQSSLCDYSELERLEKDANNPAIISNFLSENEDVAISKVLANLPLLQPCNLAAIKEYLKVSEHLLRYAIRTRSCIEEAKQILAYITLHPALKKEKKSFELLNRRLFNATHQEDFAQNSSLLLHPDPGRYHRRNSSSSTELYSHSQDDIYLRKTRSSSISLYGGPLSPQSSGTTSSGSGSEQHLEDVNPNAIGNDPILRREVEVWLKSLRLHKYTDRFRPMTYEQLVNINEKNFGKMLESLGLEPVTDGAKKKIIVNVGKMGERVATLRKIDEEISSGESLVLQTSIDELKTIINMPIRPFSAAHPCEVDIPSLYSSVLNKVCSLTLLSSKDIQSKLSEPLIRLLDAVSVKPAFNEYQKKKINEWKTQIMLLQSRAPTQHLHATPRHRNSLTLSPPLNVETLQLPKKHSLQDHIPLNAPQRCASAPFPAADKQLENQLEVLAKRLAEEALLPSSK